MAAALLDPAAREFTVVAPGAFDSPSVYSGPGLTLDMVVAEWQEEFGHYMDRFETDRAERQGAPLSLKEYARRWGDMAVWEGSRVVAVLWPHPEGRPQLLLTRMEPMVAVE